jgi:hypothetical protein
MEDELLDQLITEEEIRQRMSLIAREFPNARKRLSEAYKALRKQKSVTHLAIKYLDAELLTNEKAKDYVVRAKDPKGPKLTESDKEALTHLELETLVDAWEDAKFDCETLDKDYAKLEPQLSYYQSLMKYTGVPERT